MHSALSKLRGALAVTALMIFAALPAAANQVTHDTPPLGSAWGGPHGNLPGDFMFSEDMVNLHVLDFPSAVGPLFNETRIEPEVYDFGGGWVFGSVQTIRLNNVDVLYDFGPIPPDPVETVTFEYLDLGGDEVLSVNGSPPLLVPDFPTLHGALLLPGITVYCDPAWRVPVDMNVDGVPDGHKSWVRIVSTAGPIDVVEIGGQELWVDDVFTTRGTAAAGPCPHLVDFESRPTGETWGLPVGHPVGTFMFNEGGVDLYTHQFFPGGGGPLYNEGRVVPVIGAPILFGTGANIFRFNNMDVLFDFGGIAPIDHVTFDWLSLGGDENLMVNGHLMYIGDLELAPAPIAPGVTFSTTVIPVPGGVKGTATLRGAIDKLVTGGQEFWIDDLCARYVGYIPGGGSPGGPCANLVDLEPEPLGALYGSPTPIGTWMFTEALVGAYTAEFYPVVGPILYDRAEIDPVWAFPVNPTNFGDGAHILEISNMGVIFDISAYGGVVTVEFDWLDVGGNENLEVNGGGIYIGELDVAPLAIAPGVTFNTTSVGFVGGKKGHATLTGPVQRLRLGGQEFWIDNICIDGVPAATDAPEIGSASTASLELAASPNPFRGTTSVSYSLGTRGPVQATVYDVLGRRVATLVDSVQPAGTHAIRWDGRSQSGGFVAAGTYFIRVQTEGQAETKKLLLVK